MYSDNLDPELDKQGILVYKALWSCIDHTYLVHVLWLAQMAQRPPLYKDHLVGSFAIDFDSTSFHKNC